MRKLTYAIGIRKYAFPYISLYTCSDSENSTPEIIYGVNTKKTNTQNDANNVFVTFTMEIFCDLFWKKIIKNKRLYALIIPVAKAILVIYKRIVESLIPEKNRKYSPFHMDAKRVKRKKKNPERFLYRDHIFCHINMANTIENPYKNQ